MKKNIKNKLKKIYFLERIIWHANNIIAIEKRRKIQKRKNIINQQKMKSAICRPIISSEKCGVPIVTLKKETVETLPLIKVFELVEDGETSIRIPKMEIKLIKEAVISAHSDIILTEENAVWDKYFDVQRFDMTMPGDNNLLDYKEGLIYIQPKKISAVVENAFTLCGVCDSVWAHFLVQYLPKLYTLPFLSQYVHGKITIIVPEYEDAHIKEIVERYLLKMGKDNVELLSIDSESAVLCKNLYYLDKTAYIMEQSAISTQATWMMPKYTADLIKENLCLELKKFDSCSETVCTKLFLTRRSCGHCLMSNIDEIESFFEKEGFQIIEPHKLTLDEKLSLFWNAKTVVALPGSAATNMIFCRPGTKVLQLGPYTSLWHNTAAYANFIMHYWNLEYLMVLGRGDDNTIHSNFTIPLERIERAYKKLCDM